MSRVGLEFGESGVDGNWEIENSVSNLSQKCFSPEKPCQLSLKLNKREPPSFSKPDHLRFSAMRHPLSKLFFLLRLVYTINFFHQVYE